MTKGTLIASVSVGACVAFVLMLIRNAREGHEDKNGFHFGPSDKPAASEKKTESKVA